MRFYVISKIKSIYYLNFDISLFLEYTGQCLCKYAISAYLLGFVCNYSRFYVALLRKRKREQKNVLLQLTNER